jgi:ribosome modulation factor
MKKAHGRVETDAEGLDAYGRGVPRSDCPYPQGSDEREIWFNGWDDARYYAEDDEVKDNI